VPEETNEWRELSADDVFTAFSARLASAPPSAHATAAGRDHGDDDDHKEEEEKHHDMARALCEFAQRHGTHQGYGGWKHAYLRFDATRHTRHTTRTTHTTHKTHAPDLDRWCVAGCTRWWRC
jgi:hypothetical protein